MALRSPASFGYRVPRSVGDSERDLLWTLAFRSPVRTGVMAPTPACGVNFRRQQPVVAWVSLGALLGHNASSNLDKLCLFDEVMQRCASGPARLRMPSDLSPGTSVPPARQSLTKAAHRNNLPKSQREAGGAGGGEPVMQRRRTNNATASAPRRPNTATAPSLATGSEAPGHKSRNVQRW